MFMTSPVSGGNPVGDLFDKKAVPVGNWMGGRLNTRQPKMKSSSTEIRRNMDGCGWVA